MQASLIAAGSLDPDVVRPLVRHPRLARRYLAIEGHRALVANATCCRASWRRWATATSRAAAIRPPRR